MSFKKVEMVYFFYGTSLPEAFGIVRRNSGEVLSKGTLKFCG